MIDTIPTMVMQIQKCSKLYTTEYKIHKIVTHNDKVSLKGILFNKEYKIDMPLSSRRIAIPMDATIKSYIDFTNFSKSNIRKKGKKIEIVLPDPHISLTSTKINHKDIKRDVAFLRQDFSDAELSSYEQQGRDAIIASIPSMGITETARQSAASVIIPIITQMGYSEKDITITFRKDFTFQDYNKLIDKTTVEHEKNK